MSPAVIGPAAVIASAAGFGLIPFFALSAYAWGVSVSTLLSIRFGIAAVVFGLYIMYSLRVPGGRRKGLNNITRFQLLGCIGLGAMYAGHSTLYLTAVKLVPAALVAMCFYTYPAVVALLSSVLLRQPLNLKVIAALAVSSVGLVMVLGASLGAINTSGLLLALATSLLYSVYIIISDRIVKSMPTIWVSGITSASASLILAIVGLSTGSFNLGFDSSAYFPIFCIALVCTVIPMFSLFKGIGLIGPTKASILSMVEPLVTAGLGVVLLNQRLTLIQSIGSAVVLAGSALVILSMASRTSKALSNIAP